jgi:hypothetical protein
MDHVVGCVVGRRQRADVDPGPMRHDGQRNLAVHDAVGRRGHATSRFCDLGGEDGERSGVQRNEAEIEISGRQWQ